MWQCTINLRANHPSSSSRRVGAGRGAPGDSCVGSCTYPPLPKGFNLDIEESNGFVEFVFAGTSGSLRDHPKPFMESRKEADAMLLCPSAV